MLRDRTRARHPGFRANECGTLVNIATAIAQGLSLSRQASIAAEDAEEAAFRARAAYDECAKAVNNITKWAEELYGVKASTAMKEREGAPKALSV